MDTVLYRSTRRVLMLTALIQLAVSQIHIETITQLFVSDIGFYLFLFVLFGLLVLFNLTSMSTSAGGRLGMFIVMLVATIASGITYVTKLWTDMQTQESVLMETIQMSMIISLIILAIYAVGGIIVIIKVITNKEA